ncbi:hypothetical protein FB45DRAFT_1035374 [Roridomyces roridus]|uniref:Uncharacterized protein n=1 Tax=Roridomyces roridus TaxID=1738132 RepID=A0AAD7BAL5_9AGAR|nr:hypothetical protein FB45DRAFT_1035374 [Roridomyces roridus]
MHPSLSPSSLQLLPTAFRKTASVALNGFLDDLLQLLDYGASKPQFLNRLFLPAFYAHLGYAAAEQIERCEVLENTQPVVMAYAAVQGIINIHELPREAELEMWPGLWKWCKLIIKYDYCMPNLGDPPYRPNEVRDRDTYG